MKRLYFIAGLPRSGSTLLSNILAQNPDVHATASSGTLDVLRAIRDVCDKGSFFQAMPHEERDQVKLDMLRGALAGRFRSHEGKFCFDKNRGWLTAFEMMSTVMGRENLKAVVCVRDLRDVLASFEKLYRKTSETSKTSQEAVAFIGHRTAVGRAEFILGPKEPLGYAMDVVRDAVTRGWSDHMLLVDYDKLCMDPQGTMDRIYKFIGEETFEHDTSNVKQVTQEDDTLHSFVGLHDIRPEVRPQEPQWPNVYDKAVTATPFWGRVTEGARWWEHMG